MQTTRGELYSASIFRCAVCRRFAGDIAAQLLRGDISCGVVLIDGSGVIGRAAARHKGCFRLDQTAQGVIAEQSRVAGGIGVRQLSARPVVGFGADIVQRIGVS